MKKIALDAMGGDNAPASVVEGAFISLQRNTDLYIVFVGDHLRLEDEIRKRAFPVDKFEIIHASQTVRMDESPVAALRTKKDSSIAVALTLHRMGKVEAVVSAGNTGAQIVASMTRLGRIDGVLRPVIGSLIPTKKSPVFLLDVGANTDCGGVHLFQFGVMGAIFMEKLFGLENPRLALLSIGSEKTKGNEVSLFAHHLFSESHLNFTGNIEGTELLQGSVDVAVCDGFVGNLILKFAESFPDFLVSKFAEINQKSDCEELKGFLHDNFNPETYGGVPILGVKGVSIVCHGASSPTAFASGIATAANMIDAGINDKIAESLAELHRFYEMNKYFLNIRKHWENRKTRMGWNPARFFSWFGDNPPDEDK